MLNGDSGSPGIAVVAPYILSLRETAKLTICRLGRSHSIELPHLAPVRRRACHLHPRMIGQSSERSPAASHLHECSRTLTHSGTFVLVQVAKAEDGVAQARVGAQALFVFHQEVPVEEIEGTGVRVGAGLGVVAVAGGYLTRSPPTPRARCPAPRPSQPQPGPDGWPATDRPGSRRRRRSLA